MTELKATKLKTTKFKKAIIYGLIALVIVIVVGLFISYQPAIAPVGEIDKSSFSSQMIARGKTLYDLGDCTVCHTTKGGEKDAGGLGFATPMGTIYSSNITPDKEHGIGNWSFAAFERAMREGVNREGNYLYPAFPYTSFTHTSDEDLKALYAYLMTRENIASSPPKTKMMFPFNIRRGMYAWNLLFLDKGPLEPDLNQSDNWNRGRYLAESLGHCSACHSPRNFAMAEKGGSNHLAGGVAEGWYAPPLNGSSPAPNAWTRQDFVNYMATGFSDRHGVAAGPMGPVIADGLSKISAEDRDAIADYLASFQVKGDNKAISERVAKAEHETEQAVDNLGARIFTGSCMACHAQSQGAQLYGTRPSLALNTHFYVDDPNNVIRVVLNGIQNPANSNIGTMPAFQYNLDNEQISAVLNYIRQTYAEKPAWPDLEKKVEAIRKSQ